MISERIASSVAIPPAFLMMCASPVFNPNRSSTVNLQSIHANTASFLEGGIGSLPCLTLGIALVCEEYFIQFGHADILY
jgi:hypothetical protein